MTNDMREGFEGADVVYPKAWGPVSMLAFPEEGKEHDHKSPERSR
jgi:ornithine carbamoyltransferase